MFRWILLATWITAAASLTNVFISQKFGVDDKSCFHANGIRPCKSISFAIGILNDVAFYKETLFILSIRDKYHILLTQVNISQPRVDRHVFLTSADDSLTTVISSGSEFSGVIIGTQKGSTTHNIHVTNIEFQQFSASLAAVVAMWNSNNTSFINCVFKDNQRSGINAFDSGVTVEGCVFSNNTANAHQTCQFSPGVTSVAGGAGFVYENANGLNLIVRKTNFTGNSAAVNDTDSGVIPASGSFVSVLNYLGGGLLISFHGKAKSNRALVENSVFATNNATVGGGLYLAVDDIDLTQNDTENQIEIQGTSFEGNYASQVGGGLRIYMWDASFRTKIKDCVFRSNSAGRGGGIDVSVEKNSRHLLSYLQFNNVTWDGNNGRDGAAIHFASGPLKEYAAAITVIPEFIDCTIQNHYASYYTFTSPFTSQGVSVKFMGTNVFCKNHGAGAIQHLGGVLHVNGTLRFTENSGSVGGAVLLSSSQITLYAGSELSFFQNHAIWKGGAIAVFNPASYEFINEYNPYCFVIYNEERTKPSKWKAKVSFIENSANFMGAAVYTSSLRSCLWYEEDPFYSAENALRWNNTFEYRGNFIQPAENFTELTGPEYDIATDTHHFRFQDVTDIKLSPGESIMLDIQAYDELNHTEPVLAILSESVVRDTSHKLSLDNTVRAQLSLATTESLVFSYRLANKTVYEEVANNTVHRFQVDDAYSALKNRFSFNVTAIPCRPGFKFEYNKCICDKKIEGLLRCGNDSRTVYLKEGYWGEAVDGRLAAYLCPSNYCKCVRNGDLPGCVFNPDRIDDQCAHNRTGVLCGQCQRGLSVGLRSYECIRCKSWSWIIIVAVVIVVVIICVAMIYFNPSMSRELRGPLFFFQILPFIFEPNYVNDSVVFVDDVFKDVEFLTSFADIFNLFEFLRHFFNTCIVEGMTNLYRVAFIYLSPFTILIFFLVMYVMSARLYLVRMKFRRNSNLRSFWLMTLFVYHYLAVATFMLLYCRPVGGKRVFFYDGSVSCFEGEHLPMAVLAFILLVFVILLPIIILLITTGRWKVDPQYRDTLTDGLRPQCLWWWSVDLLRRVLLMATYAFIPEWYTKQVTMFLLCLLALAFHSTFQPYKERRPNMVETLYLITLCALTILQVFKKLNINTTLTEMANIICTVLLILTSLHALGLFVLKTVRFFNLRSKCRKTCFPNSKRGYGSMENTDVRRSGDIGPQLRKQNVFSNQSFSSSFSVVSD